MIPFFKPEYNLSINGYRVDENVGYTLELGNNMIGYTCQYSSDITEVFPDDIEEYKELVFPAYSVILFEGPVLIAPPVPPIGS